MAKKILHPAEQYARDVVTGKIVTGELVKLACQRHLDDMAYCKQRGLKFDPVAAQVVIYFYKMLVHYKGVAATSRFELEPWQQFRIWNLFGWKLENGARRYRDSYNEVARKNGKTTEAAGLGLYMLTLDDPGAEVYSAATKEAQAKICWNDAKAFVEKSPELRSRVKVLTKNINMPSRQSKFEPLGRDSDTQDGLNPSCAIIDEYHAHKTDEIFNVLKSGMGARHQPLHHTITTAGFKKISPCYQLRKSCIELLYGRYHDDSQFALIYSMDEGDEWEDPNNWIKANPSMNRPGLVSMDFLKQQKTGIRGIASREATFKVKNLNKWMEGSDGFLTEKQWAACGANPIQDRFKEGCFGALDLSSTRDITALVLTTPPDENGLIDVLPFFFVPKDTAEERWQKDDIPYLQWAKEGLVILTPGNAIDFDWIKAKIAELREAYNITSIAYDRWNSSQLVIDMENEGMAMTPFGQGFASMSTPTKMIEQLCLSVKLRHGNNPVLNWMRGNVAIQKDPAGNIKIDKAKSEEKVDGMVALAMSIGEMLTARANNNNDYVFGI